MIISIDEYTGKKDKKMIKCSVKMKIYGVDDTSLEKSIIVEQYNTIRLRIEGNAECFNKEEEIIDKSFNNRVGGKVINFISFIGNKNDFICDNKGHLYREIIGESREKIFLIGKYEKEIIEELDNNMCHIILIKKDIEIMSKNKIILHYYRNKNKPDVKRDIYNAIYNNTSAVIPSLNDFKNQKEIENSWLNACYSFVYRSSGDNLVKSYLDYDDDEEGTVNVDLYDTVSKNNFSSYIINCDENFSDYISKLLKNKDLLIPLKNVSDNRAELKDSSVEKIQNVSEYLDNYSKSLIERTSKMNNAFDPKKDEYTERLKDFMEICSCKDYGLYKTQSNCIQACTNTLINNNKKSVIVVGEMGTGKTLIGCGIAYQLNKKNNSRNIVMCPSHLVNKWKSTLETIYPNCKAFIVSNQSEFSKTFKQYNGININLFFIISKDASKTSYDIRPSAIFKKSIDQKSGKFICPTCGKDIEDIDTKSKDSKEADMSFFFKKNDNNKRCPYCGIPLFSADNGSNEGTKWRKSCNGNFVYDDDIAISKFLSNADLKIKNKKGKRISKHLLEEYDYFIQKTRPYKVLDEKERYRRPKISLNKYIYRFYRNKIDVFIADELHQYKGETLQGEALRNIAASSKYTIGLTGTLLNGYADGLFYILQRLYPRVMSSYGYDGIKDFMDKYSSTKKTSIHKYDKFTNRIDTSYKVLKSGTEKKAPRVSPLLFSDFLINDCAFITLDELQSDLPDYHEHIEGINLSSEGKDKYDEVVNNYINNKATLGKAEASQRSSISSKAIIRMSTFLDSDVDSIYVDKIENEEKKSVPYLIFPHIYDRTKEDKLKSIIIDKISKNERVLVYYEYNDCLENINNLVDSIDGAKRFTMLSSNVKSKNREAEVNKQVENGVNVMVTNPKLVETGLDLLDFTTIVFFQIGTNINTIRQSSRRSWRIGQKNEVNVYFLYYNFTPQQEILKLMSNKLKTSLAVEGKFSAEGLASGSDDDVMSSISKSLMSNSISEKLEITNMTGDDVITSKASKVGINQRDYVDKKDENKIGIPHKGKSKYLDRKTKRFLNRINSNDINLINYL